MLNIFLRYFLLFAVRTPHAEYYVLSTVSVWRGVRGYLNILAVVIEKCRSYDKDRGKK